ncbi:hypothetical protein RJD24_12315 [Bacillaceae bacterium IKA-2]|nr:hypothetical protein RJD24_12315 [Bacillaceae bacterium IKA-2]
MQLQFKYDVKLDKVDNILTLSPFIHRLIHHGTDDQRLEILNKLYNDRKHHLLQIGINITFDQLKQAYNIEV